MTSIKILKPVAVGGAIHRPNKFGNIAVVDDRHAKILIQRGFAEAAPKDAKPTFGVTVSPNQPPIVVDLETGDPAPGTGGPSQEKIKTKAELVAEFKDAPTHVLLEIQSGTAKVVETDPRYAEAKVTNEAVTELLNAKK